ncbi:MAG: helix-turn-helix domain-containing protein [Elusimicrobia bacterium]|jgi:transcriptional regulator with XRE-family HTH domain|nr:helix-turn-helix domain-containing protein [Elusimicrobiota bacterium]
MTAGEKLKEAREKQNLSITEISGKLKIVPVKLRALENGNPEVFPDRFYMERFLKTYAEFLGVEIELVQEEKFPNKKVTEEKVPDKKVQKEKKAVGQAGKNIYYPYREKKINLKKILLLILSAIIIVGIAIFFTGTGKKMVSVVKKTLTTSKTGNGAQKFDSAMLQKNKGMVIIKAVPAKSVWIKVEDKEKEIYSGIINSEKIWKSGDVIKMRIGNIYGLKLFLQNKEGDFIPIDIEEGSTEGVNDIVITNDFSQ